MSTSRFVAFVCIAGVLIAVALPGSADDTTFTSPTVSIARIEGIDSLATSFGKFELSITNNDASTGLCVATTDMIELAPQISKFKVADQDGELLEPVLLEGFMGPPSETTHEWIGPGFRLTRTVLLDGTFSIPRSLTAVSISWATVAHPCVKSGRSGRGEKIKLKDTDVQIEAVVRYQYH
jgi:hypothetical protein